MCGSVAQQTWETQNFYTNPAVYAILLIWYAMVHLVSPITVPCTYFSLPHSDTHSLFSIAALSLELVVWASKTGKALQKQQLTVKEPQSLWHLGCTERCLFAVGTYCWRDRFDSLAKDVLWLHPSKKNSRCCPYSSKTGWRITLLKVTVSFPAGVSKVTRRNHRCK